MADRIPYHAIFLSRQLSRALQYNIHHGDSVGLEQQLFKKLFLCSDSITEGPTGSERERKPKVDYFFRILTSS